MPKKGQRAAVLGWMRGFLLPLAWDSWGHIHGRRQEQPRHKKWLEKSILGRTGCSTLWQGHFCVQGRRGLRSCSVRSHQIEALQVLQRANRNILVGETSGGVLPPRSCLPTVSASHGHTLPFTSASGDGCEQSQAL